MTKVSTATRDAKNVCEKSFNEVGYGDPDRRIWQQMEAFRNPSWGIFKRYGHVGINPEDALKKNSLLPVEEMMKAPIYFYFDDEEELRNMSENEIAEYAEEFANEQYESLEYTYNFWDDDGMDKYSADFQQEHGSDVLDEIKRFACEVIRDTVQKARDGLGVTFEQYDFASWYLFNKFRNNFEIIQSEEQLLCEREAFINDNIELPCQNITRRLMEAGKITYSSNAFAASEEFPKGVEWMEPGDYFSELSDTNSDELGVKTSRTYLTDLEGRTWLLEGEEKTPVDEVLDFDGNKIDFSDCVPQESDFVDAPKIQQPSKSEHRPRYHYSTAGDCVRTSYADLTAG